MSQEEISFEVALANIHTILKTTGLQLISENNDKNIFKRLGNRKRYLILLIWFLSDFVAELAWFFDAAINGKNLTEITYPAPAITVCFLSIFKSYFLLREEPKVNDLVKTLRMLQSVTSEDRAELTVELVSEMKFLRTVTNIQQWLNILSLAGFALMPFLQMGLVYADTGVIQYFYPYAVLYPFNINNIHIFPFLYAHLLYSSFVVVYLVLGPDVLYYACCTYINIQFRYLHYDLERIIVDEREQQLPKSFSAKFKECLMRHNELIRCVRLVEAIYSKSTLYNVVSSSMLICLTGFNATAMDSWILVMPFIGFVFLAAGQIFLFCYFGDIIMRSSMRVSDAVYNCKWYNTHIAKMKDLLFVLTRAQKPCKLTAYGFSDINLTTFARILSTAWSYFALLSSVNGSK